MKNIGIDFSVLKDRIWGSFDMFRNDVTNLLGYDSASPLSMTSSVPMNYGHYVRYGWDLSINSLNFPLFSRLPAIENSIYVSFSLVFALMG